MPVKMYGPAFDESGTIVERDVPDADVRAFEQAGYVIGELPLYLYQPVEEAKDAPKSEPEPEPQPKKGKGK